MTVSQSVVNSLQYYDSDDHCQITRKMNARENPLFSYSSKKKIGVGQTLSFIKICTHTIYLIDTEKKKEKNSKENYEKTEKQNKKQIHEKHTMLVVIKKAIYFTAV